jgi:hypothetical protein
MTGMEVLVLLLSAGAIAWVNWYFFVAGRGAAAPVTEREPGAREP